MKKIIIVLVVLVSAGVGVWKFQDTKVEVNQNKPVIKIGAILPLTGDMANTGQSIKKGIEFAIEDINKNPDNKFVYQAVFEDNQMQTKNTVSAANKLIFKDKISALMTTYSSNAKAVAPLIIKNKIIGLHGTCSDIISDGIYNFRILSSYDEINRASINFINSKNPQKIAFIIQQTPASQEMVKNLKENLHGVIREFENQRGERNFRMTTYKIKEWQPDLILVSMDLPELDIFIREMQQQKVGGIKFGLDLINRTESFLSFEDFYIINSSNGNESFIKRFGQPATYYAPYFYDSVMRFANAAEKIAKNEEIPSAEDVSAEIRKEHSYEGAAGKYRMENGSFETPMILYKIKNGQLLKVEE